MWPICFGVGWDKHHINCDNALNVFSLNTNRVPIYGGPFAEFSGTLKTEFHVIILSEIIAQNLTVGETISSTLRFFVKVPMKIYGNGV